MDSIEKGLNSESEKELYRRTDEVLHFLWDPIGISGVPEARDEYHGYLPQVFTLLKNNRSEIEIAKYLSNIQSAQMGLPMDVDRHLEIARTLIEWKKLIDEKNELR